VDNPTSAALRKWILRKYPTIRTFSLATYGDKLGHQKTGHISRIMAEKCPIPAAELELWRESLGLDDSEFSELIKLAAMSHVPATIRDQYLQRYRIQVKPVH
jgi:hypothetical protein